MSAEVSCWEDGPRSNDDPFADSVGSTCLLPDGHDGPHEWTPDNQITLRFADPGAAA